MAVPSLRELPQRGAIATSYGGGRPRSRWGRGRLALPPPPLALLACLALAALSAVALPTVASYDPWSWIVWGREIADPHLSFAVDGGPSWKPLPVIFTTIYALFGSAAPTLWVITARAGGLLGLLAAWRLARRLVGPGGWGVLAGCLAALGVALTQDWGYYMFRGTSEPLLIGCWLWALDRHLDGRRGMALLLGVATGLMRPEVWPLLLLYAAWLWVRDPRLRLAVATGLIAIPFFWFVPPWIGSGHPFLAATHARLYNGHLGAHPLLTVLARGANLQVAPALVGAAAAVVWALWGRWRPGSEGLWGRGRSGQAEGGLWGRGRLGQEGLWGRWRPGQAAEGWRQHRRGAATEERSDSSAGVRWRGLSGGVGWRGRSGGAGEGGRFRRLGWSGSSGGVGEAGVAPSSAGLLTLWLAGLALAWGAIVVGMTLDGYPGLERFFLPAAALACVLAGAGVVWSAQAAGGLLAGAASVWAARLAALALLAVSVPFVTLRLSVLRAQEPIAARAVVRLEQLGTAVRAVGGHRGVYPCRISFAAINHSLQTALAWKLDVTLGRVGTSMRHQGLMFVGPHDSIDGAPPRVDPRLTARRLIARAGAWRVYRMTSPGSDTRCVGR